MQAAVEEIQHVLAVQLLGLGVGGRRADDLREPCTPRRHGLVELSDTVPVPVHQRLACEVAVEAEVGVVVIVLEAEVPRLDRAAAGDVDRRVRLLDRLGPAVHVAQLGVLAVEGEHVRVGPRLHDQVVGLVVLLAGQRGDLPVGEVGVHRGAHREARHQPAAAQAVEHGELLGHPVRRVVQGDRIADHADRRL